LPNYTLIDIRISGLQLTKTSDLNYKIGHSID
jgi:hypothetical protein